MGDDADSRGWACFSNKLPQMAGMALERNCVEMAASYEVRRQFRYQLNVEQASQPRHPISLVSADFEVIEQCAFHLDIIGVPVHVLVEGWMTGTVCTLGIEEHRSTGFQSTAC